MLVLRPQLHSMLAEASESRTLAQLEALGQSDSGEGPSHSVVELSLEPGSGPSRRLLATALLDYIMRLDPLVSEVRIIGFEAAAVERLGEHLPFERVNVAPSVAPADFSLAVGAGSDLCDLRLDGGGWQTSLGTAFEFDEEAVLNPIGPLAAACLGAGEVFKALFGASYPDAPRVARLRPALGCFCFYDYDTEGNGPELTELEIDASLVGLGGVGAGILRTLATLGPSVRGRLRLIDHDSLDLHSLNRVSYATVAQAAAGMCKVRSADAYLKAACPDLEVHAHANEFDQFKKELSSRRQERRYEVMLTALDSDEVRHAAQRELPRVLIDGSTGRDLNIRVERVVFGEWGCLGCTRQGPPPTVEDNEGCGRSTDPRAPSVSFLAALPGILATAELIKEAMGAEGSLRGDFQHVFHGGPNPEMRSEPARRKDCRVGCLEPSYLKAYQEKYAA